MAIAWKLSRKDATRIACDCGAPARYGRTADGGAPYIYECSKHVPTGEPITFCSNAAEIVAAVEALNPTADGRGPGSKRKDR